MSAPDDRAATTLPANDNVTASPMAHAARTKGLLPRHQRALDYVEQHGRITSKDYASELGCTPRWARENLRQLLELGLLRRDGHAGFVRR